MLIYFHFHLKSVHYLEIHQYTGLAGVHSSTTPPRPPHPTTISLPGHNQQLTDLFISVNNSYQELSGLARSGLGGYVADLSGQDLAGLVCLTWQDQKSPTNITVNIQYSIQIMFCVRRDPQSG